MDAEAAPPGGAGDFVAVYRCHYPRLVAALGVAGADRPAAEDLAQEAFARAYRHWRRVSTGPNPAGYVYTVGFRLLRRKGGLPDLPLGEQDAPSEGSEDATLTGVSVAEAVAAMPPRQRACAALCLYLGLGADEAADVLGIEASTVRVQVHRARDRLRQALLVTSYA